MSYLEIYNEEVRDLLGKNPEAKLEVCVMRVRLVLCCLWVWVCVCCTVCADLKTNTLKYMPVFAQEMYIDVHSHYLFKSYVLQRFIAAY